MWLQELSQWQSFPPGTLQHEWCDSACLVFYPLKVSAGTHVSVANQRRRLVEGEAIALTPLHPSLRRCRTRTWGQDCFRLLTLPHRHWKLRLIFCWRSPWSYTLWEVQPSRAWMMLSFSCVWSISWQPIHSNNCLLAADSSPSVRKCQLLPKETFGSRRYWRAFVLASTGFIPWCLCVGLC